MPLKANRKAVFKMTFKKFTHTKLLAALLALSLPLTLAGCGGPVDLIASQAKVEEPPADYSVEVSGFRYVRSTLTPQEQAVYDQIAAGLLRQDETIEDLYPDTELIQKVLTAIDQDYPEYFWFAGSGKIETSLLSGRLLGISQAAQQHRKHQDQCKRLLHVLRPFLG